jgi:hypothetical protein
MATASRHLIRMAALLLATLCAGCVSLSDNTPAVTAIQGSWKIEPSASDNTQAVIDKAVATAQARQRRRRGAEQPPPPSGSAGGGGDADDTGEFDLGGPGLGIDFKELRTRLQLALGTPAQLTLRVQPDEVDIVPQGLPGRSYQPGEHFSRIDEYGTASIDSGWSDDAFVLKSKYENGGERIERYAVDSSGRLVISLDLHDPTVGRIRLHSVYRRVR